MSELDIAIAKLALEVHPDQLLALAASLSKATKGSALTLDLHAAGVPAKLLLALSVGLEKELCSTVELAARLRTAAAVAMLVNRNTTTDLVWTGPASGLVPIRHTEQVLTGLIDGAKSRLFLVSFVAYNVTTVIDALAKAIERGVRVNILLERSEGAGGHVSVDSLTLLRNKLPKATFLEWDQTVSGERFLGASVHAKCAVADGRDAFITSANLSTAAMERNMEAGVLLAGGPVPGQLEKHLESLVATKHLKPV